MRHSENIFFTSITLRSQFSFFIRILYEQFSLFFSFLLLQCIFNSLATCCLLIFNFINKNFSISEVETVTPRCFSSVNKVSKIRQRPLVNINSSTFVIFRTNVRCYVLLSKFSLFELYPFLHSRYICKSSDKNFQKLQFQCFVKQISSSASFSIGFGWRWFQSIPGGRLLSAKYFWLLLLAVWNHDFGYQKMNWWFAVFFYK